MEITKEIQIIHNETNRLKSESLDVEDLNNFIESLKESSYIHVLVKNKRTDNLYQRVIVGDLIPKIIEYYEQELNLKLELLKKDLGMETK